MEPSWDFVMHKTAEQEDIDMVVSVMEFIENKIEQLDKEIQEKVELVDKNIKKVMFKTDNVELNYSLLEETKDIVKDLMKLYETWSDIENSKQHIESPMNDDDLQTNLYYVKKQYGEENV
jgi:quinol monooxygenase YgiN